MEFIAETIEFIVTFPFVVIGWIIVGVIAGELARRFTNAPDRSGCSDFVLGILGAFVGGLIASLLGIGSPEGGLMLVLFNLVVATIGAAILVLLWRAITGRNRERVVD